MALKFRLKGLAETFLEHIQCPACGKNGSDDENFGTDLTKVTYQGIVVVAECKDCGEIFVPGAQRLGVINPDGLKQAVAKDSRETGQAIIAGLDAMRLTVEKLNIQKKNELH
jgi:hypothetical protein